MRVNAVFQGGGVKGIGLVGAVVAAQRRGVEFHQTAGTSVGAMIAAFLAAGYDAEEMREIIINTDFQQFTDKDFYYRFPMVGPAVRFMLKKGLYSGHALEKWVGAHLRRKGIVTFGDLPRNALRVVASDISQGKLLVLPDDIRQYGVEPDRLTVAKAVRMSASLPFFYDPVKYRLRRSQDGIKKWLGQPYYIVDGGILSNYPLWIFDREIKEWPQKIPTIGFQLVGKGEEHPKPINGPISMLQALFSTMIGAHDERYIEKHSRFRTIKIPSDMVHTTEFSIGKEKLETLFHSGEAAADEFFAKWSYTEYAQQLDLWVKPLHPLLQQQEKAECSQEPSAKRP